MGEIKKEMICEKCKLHKNATHNKLKPTTIGRNPEVMVVVSRPNEDMVVRYGQRIKVFPKIEYYLRQAKIDNYYYTSLLKCAQFKNDNIKKSEVDNGCLSFFKSEMRRVKPKYVLVIGKEAIVSIAGIKSKEKDFKEIVKDGVKYFTIGTLEDYKLKYGIKRFAAMMRGETPNNIEQNIELVTSIEELRKALKYLNDNAPNIISYDIESTGLDRNRNYITAFGFGTSYKQFIIPMQLKFSPLYGKTRLQAALMKKAVNGLNDIIENTDRELVAGNGKFDDLFIEKHYSVKPGLTLDVVLCSHCFDETTPNDVKTDAIRLLNVEDWDIPLDKKTGGIKTQKEYNEFVKYLGYDILYEAMLGEYYARMIMEDEKAEKLIDTIYMRASKGYEDTEKDGVYINGEKYEEQRLILKKKRTELELLLNTEAGREVNWNSPKQVADLLFKQFDFPVIRMTGTKEPSTDALTLKQLHLMYPESKLLTLIKEYKDTDTLIKFFIDGWEDLMIKESRKVYRIYPSFLIHGTKTGRTSCSAPNLQQITKNKDLRSLISAPDGWAFLEADYSQLELRVAAHFSQDPTMLDAYINGKDIHTLTYESIFGEISNDKLERYKQRTNAKAINFGG